MLNWIGIWASSKGMVRVPDLSGMTLAQATTTINNNKLSLASYTLVNTSNSSLDDKVASQEPVANTLVDVGSTIVLSIYDYVASPYSFTPYSFTPTPPYSFTPQYSFTPYSFTPYSFVPLPPVYYISGCVGSTPVYGQGATAGKALDDLLANYPTATNITTASTSGYPAVDCTPAYSFTPTAPYSFTPKSYSFTPTYSFTPNSYSFTPTYSFTPGCIDQDTLIEVVGVNDSVEYRKASEISVGDLIWTYDWDQLISEILDPHAQQQYTELTGVKKVKTSITAIIESQKPKTLYFNGDIGTRFSLEEKIFINRNGVYMFDVTGNITTSDKIYKNINNEMVEIDVTSIDIIDDVRNVYKFNASPVDTIIAGGLIVHNAKGPF